MRLTFYLLLITASALAQKKINTVVLRDPIVHATVDRAGELYIETNAGQIQRFDKDGNLLSAYKNFPAPTLFEPRDGARLFAYFNNARRIDYMNPSFEVTSSFQIDSALVINPWVVCSSGGHNIWVVDEADGTLKKIDPRTSSLFVDIKLPPVISTELAAVVSIREYQGFIFLLHKENGIYIFNGMGKLIKTISVTGLTYFNFLGEELYYPSDGKVIFFNLFTAQPREMLPGAPFQFVLLTDERRFVVHGTSIHFFEFKP
jgi:hypothetical protein